MKSVVVGFHDGFYGCGTGAGYANHGFLKTLIPLLAPGVELVVLPIHLTPDSPEYQADWHARSAALGAAAGASVRPVDNGTAGRSRFGGVEEFARAAASAAALVPPGDDVAVVLFDVPFLGLTRHLPADSAARVAFVPRSTGRLHDPANVARVAYERDGLADVVAAGGTVVPISAYMRDHLRGDYGVPERALRDLPDGLTADEWRWVPPHPPVLPPAARDGFLIAYARAQPYKGWDDLVDALGRLRARGVPVPHAVLAAVTDQPGTTDYQRHLARRIAALDLDATLLTRFDPALRGLLADPALRAVVVPSRAEPFGRAPLEAYAAGAAPVVVTRAGGLPEQVIDGVTGFTAAPGDPASLAGAIRRAVSVTADERAAMRARGQEFARSRFDHTEAVKRFFAGFAPWALA